MAALRGLFPDSFGGSATAERLGFAQNFHRRGETALKRKDPSGGTTGGSSHMGAWGGWALAPNTADGEGNRKIKKNRTKAGAGRSKRPCDFFNFLERYPSPSAVFGARPIHPKRPYGLTVRLSPGRVFSFQRRFPAPVEVLSEAEALCVAEPPNDQGTSPATRPCCCAA